MRSLTLDGFWLFIKSVLYSLLTRCSTLAHILCVSLCVSSSVECVFALVDIRLAVHLTLVVTQNHCYTI